MKAKTSPKPKSHSAPSAEKRLHKTCDQMELLQSRISVLQTRHKRARQRSRLATAESLRMQLSVLEGVYAMYYNYAENQCQQMLKDLTPTEGMSRE